MKFRSIRLKNNHIIRQISRKSINRFLGFGLRIVEAKPCIYFHQTLSFPGLMSDAIVAKTIFTKFIKGVLKYFDNNELSVFYVEERRESQAAIHYHVAFLFFSPEKLPFSPSVLHRNLRAHIFKRWNDVNNGKAVHAANQLHEHQFNEASIDYFSRAVSVTNGSTKREGTIWWGAFKKEHVESRSSKPTTDEINCLFEKLFKPIKRNSAQFKARMSGLGANKQNEDSDPLTKWGLNGWCPQFSDVVETERKKPRTLIEFCSDSWILS